MHSDLKILDPIWTTAYIVRNHGYLIYDTLFALDDKLEPQPQMVESWTVSDDKLTWTFTLRDGLKWHDGTPVTTADVLPSIKRFTDKDVQGGLLAKFTRAMKAIDDKTFQHRAEGAVRPDAEVARQVGVGAAVRHAQAGRRAAGQPAALRHHRLRPVHLQEGRMEARREGRLRPQSRLRAAQGAAVGPGRRQGRQARPRRMGLDPRRARPRSAPCSTARST